MKRLQLHNETIKIIFCNLLNLAVIILWQLGCFSCKLAKYMLLTSTYIYASGYIVVRMDKCFDNVYTLNDNQPCLYLCEILV